jgi:hypothetical protein
VLISNVGHLTLYLPIMIYNCYVFSNWENFQTIYTYTWLVYKLLCDVLFTIYQVNVINRHTCLVNHEGAIAGGDGTGT